MDESNPHVLVNGRAYAYPPEGIVLGEMCDIERYFDVEFGNSKSSGIRMAAGMLYIAIRREDPSVTPEDVRALPPEVLSALAGFGDVDAGPPEPVADESDLSVSPGDSSRNGGAAPDEDPSLTGDPGSAASAISDPVTSPI